MKKVLLFLSAILVAQMANAWYVVGSNVDAFGGDWSTSGAPEMTLQADGTYLLADVALNTGDQFKFIEYRNWDSNLGPGATVQPNTEYNLYSGGGNATYGGLSGVCDIILDASKKTMKVVSDAGAAETTKYYVYFDNSASNWSKVNAYAWGAADFGGWPGKQLTTTTPEGYYVAEYEGVADPAGAGLIFNDGSSQTADLTWRSNAIYTKDGDTGKTYDGGVVEPETETLTYNVTVPEGTAACYIVGEFNDWAAFVRMTKVDAVRYTITLENVTKSMEYKYTCGERWDNVELTIDGSEVANRTWSESDVVEKWLTPVYGELETLTYNVTVPAGTPACYIAGEMNSWTFTEMTKVDDTHYTITFDNVTKSMQYKYTCGEDWEYVEMQADGVTDVENRTWSENDVVVAWAATPTVEQPETLTYNVTVPAGTETCYIVGDMTAWNFTEMTKVDDAHYTITFDNVTKSSKYKYTSGPDWAYVETWADGSFVSDRTWSENDVVEAWESVWSSVASVEVSDVKVYGANGMLCVRAAEKVTLNVYNAQGMLVKALVVEGAADINLAAGLYIVNGTKVLVY